MRRNPVALGRLLGGNLTQCTFLWTDQYAQHHDLARMPDIGDCWMRIILSAGEDLGEWAEFVFLTWGETILPNIQAQLFQSPAA